jgi:hypothetical protein
MENTKTKVLTIAKEMLGVEGPIEDKVLDEIAFQTMVFIDDMENLINSEEEDKMYIIADLFVANIITTALTANKLQKIILEYNKLYKEYEKLKNT